MEISSKSIWNDNQEEQLIKSLNKSSMVSITDPKGIIIYVNDTFCKESGYDEQELLGQSHRILKSEKQPDALFKGLWTTISSKRIWRGEICNKKKDGSFYWHKITIVPFTDNDGNIEKYVAIRFDITRNKENIEHLKIAEKKFKLIFDSAPDAYFISDMNGVVKNCNTAAEKLSGFTKKEIINGHISNTGLLSKTDRTFFNDSIKVPSKKPQKFEFQITSKQGKKIVVEIISHRAVIDGKNVVLSIAHDITERKTTFNELRKKTKDLELLLYRSGHDLRAPFTSLEGLIDLLKHEIKTESASELIEMVEKVLNDGKRLIDNLSASSLMLNNSSKKEQIDFNELVNQTLINLNHIDGFKKISININIPKEFKFISNRQLLRSILQNLLQNAVKYQRPFTTEHTPFIIINAFRYKDGIKISIKDNGNGIKKSELDKVFDLYYRSNTTVGGTGLGLYITKNAVEQLGGEISVTSILKKETQIDILLPNIYKA